MIARPAFRTVFQIIAAPEIKTDQRMQIGHAGHERRSRVADDIAQLMR